jgi:hypothetical protein
VEAEEIAKRRRQRMIRIGTPDIGQHELTLFGLPPGRKKPVGQGGKASSYAS